MATCICRNLRSDPEISRLAWDFTSGELIWCADCNRCAECKLLRDGIICFEKESWKLSEDVTRLYVYALTKGQRDTMSVEIYFKDDRPKLVLEYFQKWDQDGTNDGTVIPRVIRPRPSVSGNPLSLASKEWLAIRLSTCQKSHSCTSPTRTLPKRTLFLQKSGGEITVRLSENDTQQGRYISLSHCWGRSQHCVLTSETLTRFQTMIPWEILPKTFQDAIIFSVELGIFHIWIDALCIIQDSEKDWEIESAKMADVYQNSYLTLAATGSASDASGCFPSAQIAAVVAEEHEVSLVKPTFTKQVMVRKKIRHWNESDSTASTTSYPLLSRGWAYQERILPGRVLHFCPEELLWECRGQTLCECGSLPELKKHSVSEASRPIAGSMIDTPTRQRLSLSKVITKMQRPWRVTLRESKSKKVESTSVSAGDALENWHEIVKQYSALSLTKKTDRLPALSGLAVRSSPELGKYLAGLWTESLMPNLMWRVNLLTTNTEKDKEYIGPSWSWACSSSPVTYWTETEKNVSFQEFPSLALHNLHKRVLSSSFAGAVRVSGTNPYGRVSWGALTVDGFLKPTRLQWVYSRTGGRWMDDAMKIEWVPLKYDIEINPATEESKSLGDGYPYLELPFFADYVLNEDGAQHIPNGAWLQLLLVHPTICLVLKPVEGEELTYVRVGIVRQPLDQITIYGVDWMLGSVFKKGIRIL